MTINFVKYQGTGNDFIMIDDREEKWDIENVTLNARLCDRRFGIGADGLILLRSHPEYDFEMIYFNADGKVGSMCGNGGRCTVKFAHTLGAFQESTTFWAADGLHHAHLDEEGKVHLKMNPPLDIEQGDDYFFMDTGSPHYVQFSEEVADLDVYELGKSIRYNDRFKKVGTNVNFVEKTDTNRLFVRTYERGVEDETFSCGTGVTASVISAALQGMKSPVPVKVMGGELEVSFTEKEGAFEDLYLIGPAQEVFKGQVEI
ncbi:diaminopimelate epimerase [Sediminitomix flava]|uniref:Diaminopimelate epimerase n=1 Tax=Sediminitomix flava TaxID=379075 RepID=A0A315ZEU6_SEDFL|nr:diaminopimelate epimerase [Sediminitomix flava]PWJ43358.1 diaminopimelate epimerase [Sediminitomix flava]